MRSFTIWETKRRRTRWTLYLGRCGTGQYSHVLRLDRLHLPTAKYRSWSL